MNRTEQELDVEVFRSGDYGPKGRFGADELDTLAGDYRPETHEAPVTLDHAQTGPAHGWVRRLRRAGERLVATLGKISPRLREWLESGAYRSCSVELYRAHRATGRPYLKAVSFLGAAAPEVKGLQPAIFAETQAPPTTAPPAPTSRKPSDDAPKPLEEPQIPAEAAAVFFIESPAAKPARHPSDPSDLSDQSDLSDRSMPSIASTPSTSSTSSTASPDVPALLQSLKRAGRLVPAWERNGIADFAKVLAGLGADADARLPWTPRDNGDSPSRGLTPLEWFVAFLESLPSQVDFREWTGVGDGPSPAGRAALEEGERIPLASTRAPLSPRSLELHRETVAFQSDHPGVGYAEALLRVSRR